MSVLKSGLKRKAKRSLDRQLEYQRRKSRELKGREREVIAAMVEHSQVVRTKLEAVKPIPDDARVLEVGSGAGAWSSISEPRAASASIL